MGHLVKSFAVLIAVTLFVPTASVAQPVDPAKREVIERLLSEMGTKERHTRLREGYADWFLADMRKRDPRLVGYPMTNVRSDVLSELQTVERTVSERLVSAYDEQFTLAELRELLAFISSSVGQRWTESEQSIKEAEKQAFKESTSDVLPAMIARFQSRVRAGDLQ